MKIYTTNNNNTNNMMNVNNKSYFVIEGDYKVY